MPFVPPPLGVTAVMLPELDLAEQLALARELGLRYYSLRPRIIAPGDRAQPYSNWGNHKFDLTPQRLVHEAASLRRQILEAGLEPFGTVPAAHLGQSPDELRLQLEGAAAIGAGRVRINPPPYPAEPFDYVRFLDQVLAGYAQVLSLARPLGVKLVMETHAGSLAAGPGLAYNIVRHFDPRQLGVIFDLANFAREGVLVPHLAVSVLAPWIDHCHLGASRRVSGGVDAAGFRRVELQFCGLKEGDLYLPPWFAALHQAAPQAPLILEDYTPGMSGSERLRRAVGDLKQAWAAL